MLACLCESLRVHSNLILGSIANETLGVSEGDISSSSVALIIGYDLNPVVLPHAHAAVGGTEIDTNSLAFGENYNKKSRNKEHWAVNKNES